jgi:hypothetical protein
MRPAGSGADLHRGHAAGSLPVLRTALPGGFPPLAPLPVRRILAARTLIRAISYDAVLRGARELVLVAVIGADER